MSSPPPAAERPPAWSELARAARPHQWAKNGLVAVPMIAAHLVQAPGKIGAALTAFLSFSFAASSVYLINDIVDRESDRSHPVKKTRPFAAGTLEPGEGILAAVALFGASLGLASRLPSLFAVYLGLYFVVTSLYSFWLKKKVLVDVISLAGLYTLRILAGGAGTEIAISPWLMAFSMFFFLSLAFAKRYAELDLLGADADRLGRGYIDTDLDLIRSIGPACGCLSVLVLCLYLSSPEVSAMYAHPRRLWFACPVLLYWILRVWFVTHRQRLREDPVLFALRDRASWICGAAAVVLLYAARATW